MHVRLYWRTGVALCVDKDEARPSDHAMRVETSSQSGTAMLRFAASDLGACWVGVVGVPVRHALPMLVVTNASSVNIASLDLPRTALVQFFFSSRRRHTRFDCDWSSDVCSSD